ncbi:hypothetical protein SSBR45G_06820 [Bradyrhizobium sp. SSBR45G]|uniref:hypothetical protein n=1 Tax=unclassified Bradyrhizobium TaxID=2631580 RepID=UPI0023429CFD|nr:MULTISPECIES: hypothetical protein [unclassified Bradyrhizobium]GLH75774.1 hypothetical protein SSBR45G_06820 [Bradyrhizobium sp. SSBR45G]GLH85660.1 hypothetical protein SSBR45R_31200 [Bradyrhizobium sp. SSBR45R]
MLKTVSFALVVLLLSALAAPAVLAATDQQELIRDAVERHRLQTEMPGSGGQAGELLGESAPVPGPSAEAPLTPSTPRQDDDKGRGYDFQIPPELGRLLLWGAVIVGTLVIAWSLRDSLPVISRSRRIVARDPDAPPQTQADRMDEAQIEADALARQGRYADAMHLLLLNSLSEIRAVLGTSFAVSLTSREILRRVQLTDVGRQSLTSIVRNVERTYFGGGHAGLGDYSACRQNFETLKHSLATAA